MKSTLLILSFFLSFIYQISAQPEVVGSDQYGRIFDITYDTQTENKLYAVTLGNHILESTDNGETWQILWSYPDSRVSLRSLRLLPANRLSFYSTNAGTDKVNILDITNLTLLQEFELPIPPESEKEWISAYSLFEQGTDTALVLQGYSIGFANYAKVYYTTDGGNNWDEVYFNVDFNEVFPNNVAISPDNPKKLFILRGEGPTDVDGGLLTSTDAGQNWTEQMPQIRFQSITFNPEDPEDILLGTGIGYEGHTENLYRSLDGGQNWDTIPIDWTDMTLDNINAIVYNPSDLNNIIVLEENEIVITIDNFTTVQNYVYPGTDTQSYYYGLTASFNPFNGSEVFINSDFYPLFSTDGGVTVTHSLNPYFATTGNVDVSITDQAHLYYGVQYGYVHRDLSTGIDTPYDVKPIDYIAIDPNMTVIADFMIPGRVYTYSSSFMGRDLYFSNNHGANKTFIFNTFANILHTVVSLPDNPNIVWAAFSYSGESPEVYRIDFTDTLNIQSTMINLPEQDVVTGILINPNSSDSIMMAVGAKIYVSADAGSTWVLSSSGLEELIPFEDLILKLAYNPLDPMQFSIATNKGIFTSKDGGTTWTKIREGLFHNVIHSTDINGHIVGITHVSNISDFGIVYTNDGGTEWAEIPNSSLGYLESYTTDVRFIEENAEIYIGTMDLGLVKYTVNINSVGTTTHPKPVSNLSIWPNPASTTLTVKSEKPLIQAEIWTVSGKKILQTTDLPVINVSDLDKGFYLISTVDSEGNIATGRFVVD
ncbi:MAG TPA: T9SS type A sorting domain-containing protein [Lentimicrobium sp.]|nr:T9SS type A sorting domain-containing protein [Lentimicrobium sp.]